MIARRKKTPARETTSTLNLGDMQDIIRQMAKEEDRPFASQVRRLLKIALVQLGKIKQ